MPWIAWVPEEDAAGHLATSIGATGTEVGWITS